MTKRAHGPSLYYASDKNIFDALNQHKVDIPTIMGLFERRNIIISPKTPRDELAKYFARQIHDYHDHRDIAARLGIAPRRERITSMDVRAQKVEHGSWRNWQRRQINFFYDFIKGLSVIKVMIINKK